MEVRRLKCCLVGNYGVGKTSIVHCQLEKPVDNLQSTVGIDFFTTRILVADDEIILSIWDTAGAERYRSLMQTYVHGSNIVMVVYDVTDTNAMQTVTTWLRVVEQYKPGVVAIVGNKNDLTSHVHDLHDTLAPYRRLNWKIVTGTCSSRSRPSVQKIFHRCLDSLLAPQTPKSTPGQTVKFRKTKKMRKCCT